MARNAQFGEIGKALVQHYYQTFDDAAQRANLQGLYQDGSMLTYEDEQFMGMQGIMTKLTTGMKFQTVQHQVSTCDCQPTMGDGIIAVVTGKLAVDGNVQTPLNFTETFILFPTPAGSWYIHNDIFKLNY